MAGIKFNSIWQISLGELMVPITWKLWGYKFTQIAEFAESISPTDYTQRKNYQRNSNCICQYNRLESLKLVWHISQEVLKSSVKWFHVNYKQLTAVCLLFSETSPTTWKHGDTSTAGLCKNCWFGRRCRNGPGHKCWSLRISEKEFVFLIIL